MKIVKIKGGLGNQMFQYSFARLLQDISNEEVRLDMTPFEDRLDDPIRKPRILKMAISIPVATKEEVSKICLLDHSGDMLTFKYRVKTIIEKTINRQYFWESNRAYIDPQSIIKYQYYDGLWQSWRYVDAIWNEIKTEFVPNYEIHESTQKMINDVSYVNSVFIGIRKGDYTAEASHYGSFSNTYYQKAMDYVSERIKNPIFFIFSNDIPWVKKNIDFSGRSIVFREPEEIIDDFEDLLIMAACKHSIIINSTYHWWGARLNEYPGKIVVAPKHWFFDDKPIDIVPPRWVQIEE